MENRSKRIARNTVFLYFRTVIIMLVSLYTSRVILQALGEDDFGIYNVVGGIIVLFTFINGSMTTATQRYLICSLGKGDSNYISHVFSQAMTAHIIIAIIIVFLGETIGLWIVENKLNIPAGREHAAFVVYQFSILTSVLGILRCPYNASIIAYEDMSFYALICIIESVLKLIIAFLIKTDSSDRLILYALLLFAVSLIITLLCYFFCSKKFKYIRFRYHKDIRLLKEMTLFATWSLLGNASTVCVNQGAAVIMNIFYGVVVNTSLGIANQINAVTGSFVSNFQTAFMPQITKSIASNDCNYLKDLILRTSKYSFLLLFVVSLPIFINCEYILELWLGKVPTYTAGLVRVIILCTIFDALSGPLWMSAHAKGDIRNYQFCVSVISLSNLLLIYLAAKAGYSPIVVFETKIVILGLIYIYRLFYLNNVIVIQIAQWFKIVYSRIIVLLLLASIVYLFTSYILFPFLRLIVDFVFGILLVYFVGLRSNERVKTMAFIKAKLHS